MKKCFLCGSEDSVIDFTNESFKNCYMKILFRRKKKFMYGDIKLCWDLSDNIGYHSTCYKKVTVLKKRYNDDFISFSKQGDVSII